MKREIYIDLFYKLSSTFGSSKKSISTAIINLAVGMLFFLFNTNTSAQNLNHDHSNCVNFVRIEGSSNVNKFYFEQDLSKQYHHLNFYNPINDQIEIKLPVEEFHASNPLMRKDFLELIKASDFPYISITIDMDYLDINDNKNQEIASTMKVILAGQTREYQLPGAIHICNNNSVGLQGTLELDIEDFDLTPPTKFMGMVKVNQKVFIKFGLIMNNDLLTKNH